MPTRLRVTALFAIAGCLLPGVSGALAQNSAPAVDYPSRPIRIVVPFTPGGQPDIFIRLIIPGLVESFKQQIIADNRPGAGGTIGSKIVADAVPDGHTLLSVSSGHTIGPFLYQLPYDTLRDFSGVTRTYSAPFLLAVPMSLGVRSVKDLIDLAKAKPGQLNFASAGNGSGTHFAGEMLRLSAGIDVVHVPYRGITESLTDTMAGRVQFFMAPIGSAAQLVRDGKIRGLGVSSVKRISVLADIPRSPSPVCRDSNGMRGARYSCRRGHRGRSSTGGTAKSAVSRRRRTSRSACTRSAWTQSRPRPTSSIG